MNPRPLTTRERAVLDALLDVGGLEGLRPQADTATVVSACDCGCPSIDFRRGRGMTVVAEADAPDSADGLFLYTLDHPADGPVLGGIEWVAAQHGPPAEFPTPEQLTFRRA